jgi:hypothetical protein
MYFSSHSLHAPVIQSEQHKDVVGSKLLLNRAPRPLVEAAPLQAAQAPAQVAIRLTTVSLASGFDAYLDINYPGAVDETPTQLLVDSGNSVLVVPKWEDISKIPNWQSSYSILGSKQEPWGCPANVVRGPIEITKTDGSTFEIENCIFYACTADNPDTAQSARTANFGLGCLDPWSSGSANTPWNGIVIQSPLSYNASYPYAEFRYAPAANILATANAPTVAQDSALILHTTLPAGFMSFKILPNVGWMSLIPIALSIGGAKTGWPGVLASPIAMIDSGGGPMFLSDPNGVIYSSPGHNAAVSPGWISSSTNCECIRDSISVELGDGSQTITYVVDAARMPASVAGLTLVMCEDNHYMMGQNGMNIGGISFLFVTVLIDYMNKRVCLKPI